MYIEFLPSLEIFFNFARSTHLYPVQGNPQPPRVLLHPCLCLRLRLVSRLVPPNPNPFQRRTTSAYPTPKGYIYVAFLLG